MHHLRTILLRDLDTLQREVEHYPDDESLWEARPGLTNTGGTLVLHAVGNLRHYIGTMIGSTGYVRDRAAEFADRGHTRGELVALIRAAYDEVGETLEGLDADAAAAVGPILLGGYPLPVPLLLIHLSTHLAFHLGQLDYHRRIVTGSPESVSPVLVAALGVARSGVS